jgi:beta-glucosidase
MNQHRDINEKLHFPDNFIWGISTAGHQIEGNNINADLWVLENIQPTVFKEPSLDACNNFELWESDLDLAKNMGLNSYRFSLEWSRIEPVKNQFSAAMIAHYKNIIDGAISRGMQPIITLCHFTCPIWLSSNGGWTNPEAISYFVRYCQFIAKELLSNVKYVLTFNEPNILKTIDILGLPEFVWDIQREMLKQAATHCNSAKYSCINASNRDDFDQMTINLIQGHILARNALKEIYADLNVGFSLAVLDDQSHCNNSVIEAKREQNYGAWLRISEHADFIGVQNYEKVLWDQNGKVDTPVDALKNSFGAWIDATSLANSVNYIYQNSRKPIMITEHGVCTENDQFRSNFITNSLIHLNEVIQTGVPILGYIHWTLIDNFEWVHGFKVHFGLHSVDLKTFKRTPKSSAIMYKEIALNNYV